MNPVRSEVLLRKTLVRRIRRRRSAPSVVVSGLTCRRTPPASRRRCRARCGTAGSNPGRTPFPPGWPGGSPWIGLERPGMNPVRSEVLLRKTLVRRIRRRRSAPSVVVSGLTCRRTPPASRRRCRARCGTAGSNPGRTPFPPGWPGGSPWIGLERPGMNPVRSEVLLRKTLVRRIRRRRSAPSVVVSGLTCRRTPPASRRRCRARCGTAGSNPGRSPPRTRRAPRSRPGQR